MGTTRLLKRAKPLLLVLLFGLYSTISRAELLDTASVDNFMQQLAPMLDVHEIDVLPNLNHRQFARNRDFKPRLGRFPDLPNDTFPDSYEIQEWEQAFSAEKIGALVILKDIKHSSQFWQNWLMTYTPDRVIITFALAELEQAEIIAALVEDHGHTVALFADTEATEEAGKYYATAAQRLALDSQSARKLDTAVTELEYLGEQVRRNSESIFSDRRSDRRLARQEPAVFMKESLGDQYSESTVREIIVPGGVALGESAYLGAEVRAMQFNSGKLQFLGDTGRIWQLPAIDSSTLKALFDFSERSRRIQSDAIVDIDAEGRVKISNALRDTDIGFRIMHADTLPFQYVGNLNVTKSVIIDTGVDWFATEEDVLRYVTNYEVRFLSADNMRLAQTRVALEFEYDSKADNSTHRDNWGRDMTRLRGSLDYASLGRDLQDIAEAAAWIALFRKVHDEQIPFLAGRYEFMKLDKTGRGTPKRY